MNDDGTSGIGGDTESINSKIGFILNKLSGQKKEEKADPVYLKSLQDALFPEDRENRVRFRRLKQKQKTLQSVPIAIDSVTSDGRRDIKRALQDVFSFKIDVKKPDEKSGPWAKLFFILAFVIGFITGAVLGFLEQVKKFFKFLKVSFDFLYSLVKDTSIGKFITGLFKSIKLKILDGIKAIKESKIGQIVKGSFNSIKETILGWKAAIKESKFVKTIEGVFISIKSKVGSIFNAVKGIFSKIGSVLSPVFSFLGKLNVGKAIPSTLVKGFFGFISKLGGFLA